jgi:GntR family transcriptional regulator, transcriptional repressor for pyruvate dehydrogenase complex
MESFAGRADWSAPAQAESLSASIIRQIRTALFAGQVRPGDRLGTENSIAEQFGVSRMAARDALRGLVASGIVVVKPGARGGAWIAEGNPRMLSDAIAIQMTLLGVSDPEVVELQASTEVMAAELAAVRHTEADMAGLLDLLDHLRELLDRPAEFAETALDIHAAIIRAAHNRAMTAQFSALRELLANSYVGAAQSSEMRQHIVNAQRELIELIAAGDAIGARDHMNARLHQLISRMGRGDADASTPAP